MLCVYRVAGISTAVAAAFVLFGAGNAANASMIDFDVFSYTGTVTVYSTLSDAQNGINSSSGPHTIPTATNETRTTLPNARDAYVYADTAANVFTLGTAWYYTPQVYLGNAWGYGNPNNTNTGFLQLYDDDGSSLSALTMGWDPTLTQFTVSASGANAAAAEYARLWPAPTLGGASSISGGEFVEYDFSLTATFGAPVATGTSTGVTPDSVTGWFNAIFHNTGTDPLLNDYYVVNFAMQGGSSAEDNNYAAEYTGGTTFETTAARTFVAPVPLPAAWPLALTGFAMLGAAGIRRRRRMTA